MSLFLGDVSGRRPRSVPSYPGPGYKHQGEPAPLHPTHGHLLLHPGQTLPPLLHLQVQSYHSRGSEKTLSSGVSQRVPARWSSPEGQVQGRREGVEGQAGEDRDESPRRTEEGGQRQTAHQSCRRWVMRKKTHILLRKSMKKQVCKAVFSWVLRILLRFIIIKLFANFC